MSIKDVIVKYIKGDCSLAEKEQLDIWLAQNKKNQDLLDSLMNSKSFEQDIINYNLFDIEEAWTKLAAKINQKEKKVIRFYPHHWFYVASIILVLFSISFLYLKYTSTLKEETLVQLSEGKVLKDSSGEILPATSGAILVKSNGQKVTLEDSFNIEMDGSVVVNDSKISDEELNNESSYYELIVPKAKVIQFTMFDGTKVWVNANSRLKIPTASFKNERRITILSGEAYFEVAKYQNSKFFVQCDKGTIEVLGTKFNVNTSKNNFKTTLVEGSVKLSNGHDEEILTPNSAALLLDNKFKVFKANVYADLAWKNNIFYFNNLSIQRIAKQIEDWYGVKVHISSGVAEYTSTYSGELRRDVPLTEVRKMLEFISGLEVRIDGDNLNINK
ncbi:FecR family protein [Sphingobacterium litopenaei]|uniref:FecR family protein n=1 Tax=Sphingobacterium litopenaei TaxID=2763500 RepID=A0ABR7YH59_9SPHI|nr:FecR family protein [Sphingobacterium litopenaei]MBD1430662.1 FecR family protein [Sphingobacterium litopenaei]